MADTVKYLKRIKLSDGTVYTIKDSNALPLSGGTITGDLTVDQKLSTGELYILETEYIATTPTNVLVEDETTHEIKKRDIDELLNDAGGISYSMDDSTGTLSFSYGRQPK